jgi:hypothetical protein
MTLGRTSSGSIKVKTDSAGGGLRAVECACCDAAPCEGYSFEGAIITKDEFNKWLKGGTIFVAGSIFDTSNNSIYQLENGCPNGTCSWSYSNTVIVPPNTCAFELTDSAESSSCSSSYYGQNQSPFIFLQARAFKSIDEEGEVYRAKLSLTIGCPHIFWFNPCIMDICAYNSQIGLGSAPYEYGDGVLSFLGAQFRYLTEIARNTEETPNSYANLSFSFTPNP